MQFGTYTEIQCGPGQNHHDVLWRHIQVAEHADKVGFDLFCTVEHPFYPKFSINPNPLALFAVLSQRTERLRFRTLCHTLPLHNPMVLAGEIAEVDILTRGRIEVGVGRGHPWHYWPADLKLEESRERFSEGIEILLRAWTNERFSFSGRHYNVENVEVVPKPFQKPHPKIIVTGSSGKWFAMAAERGWEVCVGGPAPTAVFDEPLKTYRDACSRVGRKPKFGYVRAVFIARNEAEARRESERALLNFIKYNVAPMRGIPTDPATAERLRAGGFDFYAGNLLRDLANVDYEQIIEQEMAYVGTPDRVTEKILNLQKRTGFTEFSIISQFGDIDPAKSMQTQELFMTEVAPALRKAG